MRLTLTLLVSWVFANDHDATVTTNDFALVADLLNAWVNLHVSCFFVWVASNRLFVAVSDSATSQVVGAELYNNAILWKDLDVVLAHLS